MPTSAVGTQLLKGADNRFNLLKTLAVLQRVILQDGFDFVQCLVAPQFHDFGYICILKLRE